MKNLTKIILIVAVVALLSISATVFAGKYIKPISVISESLYLEQFRQQDLISNTVNLIKFNDNGVTCYVAPTVIDQRLINTSISCVK